MQCKYCKRDIEDDSVFCRFCGERVQRKRKPKDEITVAPPKLTPSGKYRGRVMVSGSRVWITEDTEAAYYIRARAVKAGMIEQAKNAPGVTLGSLIDKYIADNAAVLSPSTVRSYKSMRKTRFSEYMDQPVSRIPYQVMISKEASAVSAKTVKNAWRLVTISMKYAKEPIPDVNLPKTVRAERGFLDYEQIQKLLPAIKGDSCEVVYLLALHSLRLSEILALESCDSETIKVRGAMVRGENGLTRKELNKTDLSRRDVPVMIPRLAELLSAVPVTVSATTINAHLTKLCAATGLPEITLHCLRHSFASLAYHLRWTEKSTMQIGGWSTPDVVHDIYTHLSAKDKNSDVQRMRAFYTKADKRVQKRVQNCTLNTEKGVSESEKGVSVSEDKRAEKP